MTEVFTFEERDKIKEVLPENIQVILQQRLLDRYENNKNYFLLSLNSFKSKRSLMQFDGMIIYFSKKACVVMCKDAVDAEKIKESLNDNYSLVIYNCLSYVIRDDLKVMDSLEEELIEAEDKILLSSKQESIQNITHVRKKLFLLKKYYDQLALVLSELIENKNDLLGAEYIHNYEKLLEKVNRLASNAKDLREYVNQLREAYQAQIDIEQNKLMKIFTVVTAVFMPLSLLVGWYGMNLQMPEFAWKYSYPIVIVVSIIIVIVCMLVFKKKKWF